MTIVDPYGNGVSSAPGVSGDHARRLHDRIVNALGKLVKAVGVPVKGGYDGTCKGTFGKSFAAGAEVAEERCACTTRHHPRHGHRRSRLRCGTFSLPESYRRLQISFCIEHKTLASLLISVQARARLVPERPC